MARPIIGTSHEGRYEYYERERYIYQRDTRDGRECGWICALSVWDQGWPKSGWITKAKEARNG